MDPVSDFKDENTKTITALEQELRGIRANRATASLVEDIKVDYYGQQTPVQHLASISVQPPRELQVQVWDQDAVSAVARAIESAGLGLSANTEGNTIRLFLPELSNERREELIKHIKKVAEGYRISVRTSRDDANKAIEKAFDGGDITEDDKFTQKEHIQEETERVNKVIEDLIKRKEEEIRL